MSQNTNILTTITMLQRFRKKFTTHIFNKKFLAVVWKCRKPLLAIFFLLLLCDLGFCYMGFFYLFDSQTSGFISAGLSLLLAISVILEKIYSALVFHITEKSPMAETCEKHNHTTFHLVRFALACLIILFIFFNAFAVFCVSCVLFSGMELNQIYNVSSHFRWFLQESGQNFLFPFCAFLLTVFTYFSPQIVVYLSDFAED